MKTSKVEIKKAYKFRMFPTPDQATMINKTLGSCRWLYNYALHKMDEAYKLDGTKISINDISKELPTLKKTEETAFLKEVSSVALIYALQNLKDAYNNFYRKVKKGIPNPGYPKFKRKFDRHRSYQFHQGYVIDQEKGVFDAPKIPGIKTIFHRPIEGLTKTCTISVTPSGKYYVSILAEQETTLPVIKKTKTLVVHLGLRNFAYLSTGEVIAHPKTLSKYLNRLKTLQRQFDRLKNLNKDRKKNDPEFKGRNIEKKRLQIARLHEKVGNIRADFLHNLSADIVKKGQYTDIFVENWAVSEMIKNPYLSQLIADSGWRSFWNRLQYKSEWTGVRFHQTEKKFPSSKQCSECGYINPRLRARIIWKCPTCGTIHDREQNALNNIEKNIPLTA